MVSTSTWVRIDLMCSLCSTPKRCSSSTTTRPRSFQRHAGLQQPVRADHDVDRAVLHALEHRPRLGGVGEPGQPLHGDREPGHPLGERLQVLIGQQRRRHQHRDLLAVLHRLERRAHRDLGLAVADVAADHPVHRDRLLHVGLDLGDRGHLVDGLGEPERVLHLGLPRGVRAERVARRRPAAWRTATPARRRSREPPCAPWSSCWPSRCRRAGSASATHRRRSATADRASPSARRAGRIRRRACSTRTRAPGTRGARRRRRARSSRRTGRCRAGRAPPGRRRSAPAGRRRCGAWRPAACPRWRSPGCRSGRSR